MKKFSGPALDSLRESIMYSVDFLERHCTRDKADLFGETAVQVLRDLYLLKKGFFLNGSVGMVFWEFNADVPEEDRKLILKIEKSLRKEEDYLEVAASIGPREMGRIMAVLKNMVK